MHFLCETSTKCEATGFEPRMDGATRLEFSLDCDTV